MASAVTKNLHNSDRFSKPITLCWPRTYKGPECREQESVTAAQKMIAKLYITKSKPSSSAWNKKIICLCAPTTHAASFKCHLHRTTSAPPKSSLPKDMSRDTRRSSRNFHSKKMNWKPQLSRFGRAASTERQTQTVASVKP